VWVKAVSRETIHAIFELIKNALESFPDAEPRQNRIDVSVSSASLVATLSIHDNGSGISESEFAHLFDPYYATKKISAGFGFGLIYCRNVISAIGGELKLKSKSGEGTTASIFLTQAAAPSPDSEPPAISHYSLDMKKRTILFVDPDIMLRRLARRTLAEFDVVTCAPNLTALQSSLQQQTYDLIICDIGARVHTPQLLQDALESVNGMETPVIYMTSSSIAYPGKPESPHSRIFEISKPFDLQQLREMVYQSLSAEASGAMTTIPVLEPPFEKSQG
jgi:CheY-like chemotaxis protein